MANTAIQAPLPSFLDSASADAAAALIAMARAPATEASLVSNDHQERQPEQHEEQQHQKLQPGSQVLRQRQRSQPGLQEGAALAAETTHAAAALCATGTFSSAISCLAELVDTRDCVLLSTWRRGKKSCAKAYRNSVFCFNLGAGWIVKEEELFNIGLQWCCLQNKGVWVYTQVGLARSRRSCCALCCNSSRAASFP